MVHHKSQLRPKRMRLARCLAAVMVWVYSFPVFPAVAANELNDCMAHLLEQASAATTVGELRSQCNPLLEPDLLVAQDPQTVVFDDRLQQDRQNVLRPFALMAHRPNYIPGGTHNFASYDSALFQQQFGDSSLQLKDTEFQFQISLKVPLGINIFNRFDLYAAYTNRSFWQLYNSRISSPFRETNHEPEAWLQFTPHWEVFGFRNSTNAVGIVHQSNGRGGVLSRSWNRV